MPVGDGIVWSSTVPTDTDFAYMIDDYIRHTSTGVQGRMDREHVWPAAHTGTSSAGHHRFVTFQALTAAPVLSAGLGQVGAIYMLSTGTGYTVVYEDSGGTSRDIVSEDGTVGSTSPTYSQGVIIENNASTPNTKIDANADVLSIENISVTSVDLTIDCSSTGANKLDAGSLAADTWYYVWAIYDPSTTTTAGLISTSATSPTMPTGYTKKRLIGYCKTNASTATFDKFIQFGNNFYHDTRVTLASASGSGWTTGTECNTTGKRGIPPGVRCGLFSLICDDLGATIATIGVSIRPNGSSANDIMYPYVLLSNIARGGGSYIESAVSSSQKIDWYVVGGGTTDTVYCNGFRAHLF